MNIVGTFIKGLAWRQRDFLPTLQLHHNGTFQHIEKSMRVVPMDRIGSAGRIHYSDHQTFLAGKFWQVLCHERCDLGLLCISVLVKKNASTNIGFKLAISCSPPLFLLQAAES